MNRRYVPNEVPLKARLYAVGAALLIIAFGSYGLHANEFVLGLKRGRWSRATELHLHDVSALALFIALIFGAAVLILEVVDHYDRRDNEHVYHALAIAFTHCGLIFLAFALGIAALEKYGVLGG